MRNAAIKIPKPQNEPAYSYAPNSQERKLLEQALAELKSSYTEIPAIIGGQEIKTNDTQQITAPHDHTLKLGKYHKINKEHVEMAIERAMNAKKEWSKYDWFDRAAIFLRVAELFSTKYRYKINAATMLGLSKNVFQSEIDAVCELTDFIRFDAYYVDTLYREQPLYSSKGIWNVNQFRPIDGFVLAIPPFNFLSITGNLPIAPAMLGNVVLWKPSENALYPPYFLMQIMKEAGLPDGVINFLPGDGPTIGESALSSKYFGGLHFTGSISTFQFFVKKIGEQISNYQSYPRIVGETGGKDFIVAHSSANIRSLVTAIVRGSFEYQGQKCSAVSRVYVPESIWQDIKELLFNEMDKIKMGPPDDFSNFVNAVIDRKAFNKIKGYIDYVNQTNDGEIIKGGLYDDSKGFFIEPTVVLTKNPYFRTMTEEIFGPVVTIYVYNDQEYEKTLYLCDSTSPYGLTGAIFANDRNAIRLAVDILESSAGNFYINDKPTGAIVGQQPFGGSRASGTNDKAGSYFNIIRWASVRTIKENFTPPESFEYPFMYKE